MEAGEVGDEEDEEEDVEPKKRGSSVGWSGSGYGRYEKYELRMTR